MWTNVTLPFPEHTVKRISTLVVETVEKIPGVVAVLLFGSFAKGTWNSRSDIDMAVLFDTDVSRDTIADLHEIFESRDCDGVPMLWSTFAKGTSRIAEEIRRDGIVLWKNEELIRRSQKTTTMGQRQ